jgi:hypothetical protein
MIPPRQQPAVCKTGQKILLGQTGKFLVHGCDFVR